MFSPKCVIGSLKSATLEMFWRYLDLSISCGFWDINNSGNAGMLCCSGSPDSVSVWYSLIFFPGAHGECMPELCHLLTYWEARPFLFAMSALFYKLFSACFPCEELMLPGMMSGCRQEKPVSGVSASSRFLLSTCAPRQDWLLPDLLLLCRMATLTVYIGILCSTSDLQQDVNNWVILTLCGDSGER